MDGYWFGEVVQRSGRRYCPLPQFSFAVGGFSAMDDGQSRRSSIGRGIFYHQTKCVSEVVVVVASSSSTKAICCKRSPSLSELSSSRIMWLSLVIRGIRG
jgi:hypothetical protein